MLQNPPVPAQGLDAADPARWWLSSFWIAVLVGCVYILSARMSLSLLTPDGVAVFWPAAGVAAGMLIAIGPSARWAIAAGTMVATIVANLLGDRNVVSAIVFALCNAGEALLVAGLIERSFGSPFSLDRLRHVLGLLAAAIIATAVSGIGGTLGFAVLHGTAASIVSTWRDWFASDALGIVTIAPLVIGLASAAREPPPRSETIEGLAALALLIVLSVVAIALPPHPWTTVVPIAMLFPVLLWIAARCRPVFAAAAAFIVTFAIVWATTIGIGRFGDAGPPMADRVLAARAGILAVALCALVLAALFAERRQHVAALAESEATLQDALTAGAVTTFVWDVGAGSSRRSVNAAQVLGFDPRQAFGPGNFLARVHPDDRERFKALVRGVNPEHPAYTLTFRFSHPDDGREVWLEETATAEFDAAGRLARLKGLTLDVTARKRSEDQQRLLIAALDQRVGNLLARVAVVARDSRQGKVSLDEYFQSLDRRFRSMADAYALLSQNSLGRRRPRRGGSPSACAQRDGRKCDHRRSARHAHGRGNPGAGDGAARAGVERCEIRRAVEPAWPSGGDMGPRARRECGQSVDQLARNRRPRRCNFARLQIRRRYHSRSHPARARRFRRPRIRTRRRLLQDRHSPEVRRSRSRRRGGPTCRSRCVDGVGLATPHDRRLSQALDRRRSVLPCRPPCSRAPTRWSSSGPLHVASRFGFRRSRATRSPCRPGSCA